jgi:cysteine desulfurase/selenocysteine lyase
VGPTTVVDRGGAVCVVVGGVPAHDLGPGLDDQGNEVRGGHHCAEPLHRRMGVMATTRASFGPYNGEDDVHALLAALQQVRKIFGLAA